MLKRNQNGVANLLVPLALTGVLLIVALAFGFWAFASRQDYKNHTDDKIATAVAATKTADAQAEQNQVALDEAKQLSTYKGPQAFGSLIIQYPRTWSGYVDASGTGNALVDAYFSPGVVPSISSQSSVFALRVQILSQDYTSSLQNVNSAQQNGQSTVTAYSLPKVPNAVGVEVVGQLPDNSNGTMIILPLRNNTLEIWTDGNQYLSYFNSDILPNFSFSP